MSESAGRNPVAKGRFAIFTAEGAPTLEETGMMDEMTYPDADSDDVPMSEAELERLVSAARITIPFRQAGPGGFSLVSIDFAPGYLLPRHSHSSDCLYYIVAGSIRMGRRELGPGDGFFLPADQPYAYQAGPDGVKLLEFRNSTAFDMQVYEKSMKSYREKAMASMDAPEAHPA